MEEKNQKSKLFTQDELVKALNLNRFGFLAKPLAALTAEISKLNYAGEIYYDASDERDIAFLEKAMKNMRVQYEFEKAKNAEIPSEGAFITVSNHPFGMIDGILLILVMAKERPDFRVMANYLLQKFKTIDTFFIPGDPFEGKNQTANSLKGIKLTLQNLREGHPVGIFPAGEVSTFYKGQEGIMDKEWQESALKIIQKAKVPVIPIFFHGENSGFFHFLGKINPVLRTAWLVREFHNKRNKSIKITVREAISPEKIAEFSDTRSLGLFLREKTYGK